MDRLKDKVTVVAGGGTGIGAAVCERLSEEGARVVVGDLNADAAEATAKRINTAGGQAIAVEFDARDEQSVTALIRSAVDAYGRLDGLHVNVADMSPKTQAADLDALEVPIEVWDSTMAINLRGHLFAVRAAIPELQKVGGGALVFTSSGAAYMGEPARVAYAASKAGVNALMRHIAQRWGREGIRANCVAPGVVLTESALAVTTEEWRDMVKMIVPHTRHGQPKDIAAVVALLLSDDAEWINGQCISVDGGISMR